MQLAHAYPSMVWAVNLHPLLLYKPHAYFIITRTSPTRQIFCGGSISSALFPCLFALGFLEKWAPLDRNLEAVRKSLHLCHKENYSAVVMQRARAGTEEMSSWN